MASLLAHYTHAHRRIRRHTRAIASLGSHKSSKRGTYSSGGILISLHVTNNLFFVYANNLDLVNILM